MLQDMQIHVVPDQFQQMDILIGRTFSDAPSVDYFNLEDLLTFFKREDAFLS